MESRDLDLRLCAKDPIFVDGVPIYPISIKEISRIGYTKYNTDIRFMSLNESDIGALLGRDISDIGSFNYLVGNAIHDKETMQMMLFWLSKITHSKITFSGQRLSFVGDGFEITKDNFDEIQSIVRLRNGLQGIEEEEENPDNEAARRVLQRRKEERLKRRKAKSGGDESSLTLADLVSILASGMGMTMDEIMEYDLYQFNDQFNRLKIMEDYEVNVQALLHGAKKEDVKLTHWITKIKREEE